MSSYFQSYFQASSMPKRLLQYVLSRLEILDTDTLDLENLNVAWGKNSSIEFKNVGLRRKKLDTLLQLPPRLELSKACISLLRLTIPVDIYSSSILIEVDGIDFQLRIKAQDDEISGQSKSGFKSTEDSATEWNGFNCRVDEKNEVIELPSVKDLAQSFLQIEPEEGKAKLAAAISSEMGEVGTKWFSSDEPDVQTGTGASLTVPTFMVRFLQGVIDRLQVKIQNVNISFTIDLHNEGSELLHSLESKDPVTIRLVVQNINIEGMTQVPEDKDLAFDLPESGPRPGKRLVFMSQIRGYLISDTTLFSSLANSPTISHTSNACLIPSSSIVKAFDETFSSSHDPNSDTSGTRPESPRLPPRPLSKLSQHRISQSHSLPLESLFSDHNFNFNSEFDTKSKMHPYTQKQDNHHDKGSTVLSDEEDLTQSKLFTHDEAESMYMSAVSYKSSQHRDQTISDVDGNIVEYPNQSSEFQVKQKARHMIRSENINLDILSPEICSPHTTDQSQALHVSPTRDKLPGTPVTQYNQSAQKCSQIFELDQIEIYIPSTFSDKPMNKTESEGLSSFTSGDRSVQSDFVSLNVPGAFLSQSSNKKSSPIKGTRSAEYVETKTETDYTIFVIEINIGSLTVQFDAMVGRLALKLATQVLEILKSNSTNKFCSSQQKSATNSILELNAKKISLEFLDRLEDCITTPSEDPKLTSFISDILLQTKFVGLHLKSQSIGLQTETSVSLKKFLFGYKDESIVSFDVDQRPKDLTRGFDSSTNDEISARITQTANTTYVEVSTLPLHISINLQKLDETFSWFGGLSSVLSLGSSFVSNKTVISGSPDNSKVRGVRFDTPSQPDTKSLASAQNKANIRIGGFKLDLKGSECGLKLETSAIKTVIRDEGIGFSIQNIQLLAPYLYQSKSSPAIMMELISTRVEFLSAPKDSDLDRLLSLITPSKTKYGLNDDILLDTLLRQRNKGAVLRLTIDHLKTNIEKLTELAYLPELSEEVSRLATVANYLPDDDRPGLLSLILIRKIDFQFNSAHELGTISFSLAEFEIAQINLPALLAVSIGDILVNRNKDEKILEIAIDPDLQESSAKGPVIMARVIGNEMEPVIRIKLSNLNLEYRVPTILSLIDFIDNRFPQELSSSVSASAATLTGLSMGQTSFPSVLRASKFHDDSSKPLAIDIDLRNCVLGLNPLGLPSKVAFVLSEAYLGAILSKDQGANDTSHVELKKASILVIDNAQNLIEVERISRKARSFDGGSSQVAYLCGIGYVSVGFISSAKAVIHKTKSGGEQSFLVEISDDLLVLESCADSTQTLIAVINGLTPPTPPSCKDNKYRTKVIPIHDLLASLSTDAFGTAEGDYNFDDDFGLIDGFESDFPCEFDEDKEFDSDIQYDHHKTNTNTGKTSSPGIYSRDTQDGVLLESILEPRELDDDAELEFQENHFGPGSILEGPDHRWNSVNNTYDRSNSTNMRRIPLKVCVRDVHIIWNLFDGYDWQHTRDTITKAVQNVESKVTERKARNERGSLEPTFDTDDEASVIEDFLFNSIYIGVPANRDPRDLASAINHDLNDNATETESIATTSYPASTIRSVGIRNYRASRLQLNRSRHHKITFELRGIYADFIAFPSCSGETQSTLDIRVRDFDIFDHVPTSTWRKFATYMQDAGERETGSSMIHLEIINVKPVAELAASEMVLKATILPLRLHVDQDALDFITRFFEFKDDASPAQASKSEEPFLQRVEVNSIKIRLDFKPKRVNYAGLRSGRTTEFMNFLILDEADMELRHTIIYGISGFEKLGKCLNDIWMPDVKRNQLPGILAGLAPVKSLVNVGGGFRHLIVVPMREYKKDGRIVRSISKGATAFARVTGTELVKLGAKVAIGVQTVLQGAEDLLTSTGDSSQTVNNHNIEEEQKQISLYANQPIGVLQGLRGGYDGLQRDLLMARDAIIAVPGEVMESGTAAGALRSIGKYAPTVILRPAIGVAKAGGQILMGATNSLDPVNLQRAEAKYKKH